LHGHLTGVHHVEIEVALRRRQQLVKEPPQRVLRQPLFLPQEEVDGVARTGGAGAGRDGGLPSGRGAAGIRRPRQVTASPNGVDIVSANGRE